MDEETPKFLFRAFSIDSNGSNESQYFAPQVSADIDSKDFSGLRYDDSYGPLRDQLHHAVMGYVTTANPFTFWTSSFICVLLHALKKLKNGEREVQIICIPASRVKNGDGDAVAFRWLPSTMRTLKMRPIHARWTGLRLDFADVWITTDTVMVSDDSMKVSLSALISNGLHGLLPALGLINKRAKTGLATPLADLRQLWFGGAEADMATNQITLAAQLAMAFKPISPRFETGHVSTHLFAWFLALKTQDPEGVNLGRWLSSNSFVHHSITRRDGLVRDEEATLESAQWARLYVKLQEKRIPSLRVLRATWGLGASLLQLDTVQCEEEKYKQFKKQKREALEGEEAEEEAGSKKWKRVRLCVGG